MANIFNPQAFQALKVRDFRLYWFGNTLSVLGNEMQTVALAWQIYLLTNEPLSLGLIGLIKAIPAITFSIFGGALADAMDRRRLLFITQTILLSLSTTLAVLTFTNTASIGLLYLLVFLASIAQSADSPAHSAVVPSLVPRTLIANAINLNNLSWSTAGIVGPAMGGFIIGWLGVAPTYVVNAVSYLAVVWVLIVVRTPLVGLKLTPEERTIKGSLNRIKQGFGFLRRTPILLHTMILDFVAVLFGGSLTLLPVFAKDILKIGPEGFGILASAPAVGSILGAFGLTLIKRPKWPGRVVLGSIFLYGLCAGIFGLSTVFWLSWLALAGTGAFDTISMAMRQSIRQIITPPEMQGRLAGINYSFAASGTNLGEFEAGVVAQILGAQPAVAIGGFACAIMVCGVSFFNTSIKNFVEKEQS